jgi:hypothetical protein
MESFHYFLAFEIRNRINTTTRPTRKNAHHIPALKIVSTAPQLLRRIRLVNKKNSIRLAFINADLNMYRTINSTSMPS